MLYFKLTVVVDELKPINPNIWVFAGLLCATQRGGSKVSGPSLLPQMCAATSLGMEWGRMAMSIVFVGSSCERAFV